MGFFSWKTQDTNKSIPNNCSGKPMLTVFLVDDKGKKWKEEHYAGYGVFGGKDFYELLAEMNSELCGDIGPSREIGIDLAYDGHILTWPSLTEDGSYHDRKQPETCEHQGYFYPRGMVQN